MKFGIGLLFGLLASMPVFGAGISYDCASNIETSTCTYLNNNIAGLYAGVFTNANANIYIQYGSTGLGSSAQIYNSTTFNDYLSALTSHEGDVNDATAVATLQGGEPSIFNGGDIFLTSALDAALGLSGGIGTDASLNSCTLGPSNPTCYNGVITLAPPASLPTGQSYYYRTGQQASTAYDIYSVVEHETDEILGTSSCIGTLSSAAADVCAHHTDSPAPADLFRYSAAGTRSFVSQGSGSSAYFSINGGTTSIASYINSPNSGDYGDWSTNCTHIQDATGCLGQSYDITSDGRVEITVLDAVGYNLVTPEPGTFGVFGLGLFVVVQYRRRRLLNR